MPIPLAVDKATSTVWSTILHLQKRLVLSERVTCLWGRNTKTQRLKNKMTQRRKHIKPEDTKKDKKKKRQKDKKSKRASDQKHKKAEEHKSTKNPMKTEKRMNSKESTNIKT